MRTPIRSARHLLTLVAASAAIAALAASAALVVTTRLMHAATRSLADAMSSVRASGEVDTCLLLASREQFRLTLTGDAIHRHERDRAVAELHDWLARAGSHASDPAEAAEVDRARQAALRYVEAMRDERAAHLSPAQRYEALNPLLVAAQEATGQLIRTNFRQAETVRERVARWDLLADALGFAAMALVLAATAALLWLLRGGLLRPLLALRATLARYGDGDRSVRVHAAGLREIRDVAGVFNAMADRLERARDEQMAFAAGVAHDLRNPLSALRASTWVPAARLATMEPEQLHRRFEVVHRQVDRLDALVDDLLEVSRMDAGRLELRPAMTNLASLAAEAVELHAGVAADHRVELDADAPVPAACDGARIMRVLNNLVGNAVKFSPKGSTVRVRARRAEGHAVLEVEDEGPGIAPEDAGRLFEPFQRGGGRLPPGLGLGLYVARRLVEAHGGSIRVERAASGGSIFRVLLPAGGCDTNGGREFVVGGQYAGGGGNTVAYLDSIRISARARYSGNFSPQPRGTYTTDGDTRLLLQVQN